MRIVRNKISENVWKYWHENVDGMENLECLMHTKIYRQFLMIQERVHSTNDIWSAAIEAIDSFAIHIVKKTAHWPLAIVYCDTPFQFKRSGFSFNQFSLNLAQRDSAH